MIFEDHFPENEIFENFLLAMANWLTNGYVPKILQNFENFGNKAGFLKTAFRRGPCNPNPPHPLQTEILQP